MKNPVTESENPKTRNIDQVSTIEALRLINSEDKKVAHAVEKTLGEIAETVDKITLRLSNGGRLFYVGTGTSGRLGVLDASEIPPTYGVSPGVVRGIIAGGYDALHSAVEASEDDHNAGAEDLKDAGLKEGDAVIGIAASGRTPYTIGAVEFAKNLGCFTACISCNPDSPIAETVDIAIVAEVGAEAITGSTRMKAGTAQKMILNMISTAVMIKLGYVSGNRMTNLKPKNSKLVERSVRILMQELELTLVEAGELFGQSGQDLRVAVVMGKTGASRAESISKLEKCNWVIKSAVAAIGKER
ncbi:MAG: N-acetylmuramic acid 6-phosphate etherase [Pyrinomonadaceae bacterium]